MRIIAGSRRSLPLETVPGLDTRPTTDRIKETLFNILNPRISDAAFLDLFAGSGQIGLEALSRGAASATFVESGKKQQECIKRNISFTKFENESQLLGIDVFTALRQLEGKSQFDIVFMDPPYDQEIEKEVLSVLSQSRILNDGGLIVVEASLKTNFSYLDEMDYEIVKEKNYKTNKHIFLCKKDA